MRQDSHREDFAALASVARWQFDQALDYVWKAPTLIEALIKEERSKLDDYCREEPRRGALRWALESDKLLDFFPLLLANGNLFSVCSMFESYVLRISAAIEVNGGPSLVQFRGQGIARSFEQLRSLGVETASLLAWPQVDALFKVRNCLVHASGLLNLSRHGVELRRIVESRTYLAQEHRERTGDTFASISISPARLGDQIRATNGYVWIACSYLRDYFLDLCEAASGRFSGSSNGA